MNHGHCWAPWHSRQMTSTISARFTILWTHQSGTFSCRDLPPPDFPSTRRKYSQYAWCAFTYSVSIHPLHYYTRWWHPSKHDSLRNIDGSSLHMLCVFNNDVKAKGFFARKRERKNQPQTSVIFAIYYLYMSEWCLCARVSCSTKGWWNACID